jgi:lipopolysaccharide/colanic/teichoic acid biosynthesis glycosyltransferase
MIIFNYESTCDRKLSSLDRKSHGRLSTSRWFYLATKRIVDFGLSSILIVLASPLMLLIALAIKMTSHGPILFRQRRLGYDGRPFQVLKFRTMVADAESRLMGLEAENESSGGVLFKMRRDPRVTPLGRLLRRTSVDELPQLLNILKGDMALVGPRPLQQRDCDLLRQVDPSGFALRHTVRPGLTGLWQVGGRSEVGHDRMTSLDLEYIARRSLVFDLEILARTFVVVLVGRGAC